MVQCPCAHILWPRNSLPTAYRTLQPGSHVNLWEKDFSRAHNKTGKNTEELVTQEVPDTCKGWKGRRNEEGVESPKPPNRQGA